jgi:GT2 family glycosyltransferase
MITSVIIPTYKRSHQVIENTVNSIVKSSLSISHQLQIILIDQNNPSLTLSGLNPEASSLHYQKIDLKNSNVLEFKDTSLAGILHLHGISPSVTRAKNIGLKLVQGEVCVFFDDDVTVMPNCIENYIKIFKENPDVGFLGGRETIDLQSTELVRRDVPAESNLKRILRAVANMFAGVTGDDLHYQANGQYVGRIKKNSFMIKNFNVHTESLIKIDGARGCNWACRKEWLQLTGGFDEHYQGTALREETDLYLRLGSAGAKGYYTARSRVIHHRQLGGCENLAQSLVSLESKFSNELYFQKKHFADVSFFYFAVRTLPLMLDSFSETKGRSMLIWAKSVARFLFASKQVSVPS